MRKCQVGLGRRCAVQQPQQRHHFTWIAHHYHTSPRAYTHICIRFGHMRARARNDNQASNYSHIFICSPGGKEMAQIPCSSPPAFTSTDSRFHLTRRSICSCIFFFPALAGAETPKKQQNTCKGETKEILFYNYFFLLYISKLHFSFSVFLRTLAAPLLLSLCVILSFCGSAILGT